MTQRFLIGLLFCASAFACASSASGHPHVWVAMRTELLLSPKGKLVGLRHAWTFDEGYTAFALEDLEGDKGVDLSPEKLQPLADENIKSLKEFAYFTYAFAGEKRLDLKDPAPDYRLEYKNKLLTLFFTLPLETPLPRTDFNAFNFSVYDPGMYVSLTFEQNSPVTFSPAAPTQCRAHVGDRPLGAEKKLSQLGEAIDPASNIGSGFAERVTLVCKG